MTKWLLMQWMITFCWVGHENDDWWLMNELNDFIQLVDARNQKLDQKLRYKRFKRAYLNQNVGFRASGCTTQRHIISNYVAYIHYFWKIINRIITPAMGMHRQMAQADRNYGIIDAKYGSNHRMRNRPLELILDRNRLPKFGIKVSRKCNRSTISHCVNDQWGLFITFSASISILFV